VLLYYITDRSRFPGDEAAQRASLLTRIAEAARAGVDYIQLREKNLDSAAITALAHEALALVRAADSKTRLLINSRVDLALASGADGVHLTGDDLRAQNVAAAFAEIRRVAQTGFLISASCHSVSDVRLAASLAADFVVLAPIFGKEKRGTDSVPLGLGALAEATRDSTIRVLALGGVSLSNADECLRAGAAGIAGIRLFQQGNIAETVRQLRAMRA
jgi:thiamine-phosphate pyrophosphorylase